MTGKLIKHEWKTYSRAMIPILLFMAAITAAMWIANLFADEGSTRLAAFWFIMYSCTAIAVSVIAFLRPAVRFSKNLYGDEGYLMQTLPCSKHALILSKGIVAGLWNLILVAALLVSMVVSVFHFNVISNLIMPLYNSGMTFGDFWILVSEDMLQMPVGEAAVFTVLAVVTWMGMLLALLYMCVSIGQLWRSHTLLGTVLALLASVIVLVNISSRLMYNHVFSSAAAMHWSDVIFNAVVAVICYIVTELLMSRRLNL